MALASLLLVLHDTCLLGCTQDLEAAIPIETHLWRVDIGLRTPEANQDRTGVNDLDKLFKHWPATSSGVYIFIFC